MVVWTFVGCALMNTREGEKVWFGSKSSSPQIGKLIYTARGVDVKTLRLFIFV